MNRRTFLSLGAAGVVGAATRGRLLAQNPSTPAPQALDQIPVAGDDIPIGKSRLGIADGERDGTVYVPQSYKKGVPMPFLMMLHGFRSTAEAVRFTFPLAEEFGVIVLAPESRDMTWGMEIPGFDTDARYLGMAVPVGVRRPDDRSLAHGDRRRIGRCELRAEHGPGLRRQLQSPDDLFSGHDGAVSQAGQARRSFLRTARTTSRCPSIEPAASSPHS